MKNTINVWVAVGCIVGMAIAHFVSRDIERKNDRAKWEMEAVKKGAAMLAPNPEGNVALVWYDKNNKP